MLAITLGLAWLLLAPLCLWFLIRGRNLARLGAVATLALLEASTVGYALGRPEQPVVVAHDMPAPTPEPAACEQRKPVPQSARLVERQGLRLTWPAAANECETAQVVVRPQGRKLRIWIHEGTLAGHHANVQTLPVRVNRGAASLQVQLPTSGNYRPVDGRTNERIPTAR